MQISEGAWQKRGGVGVFEWRVDTTMHTMFAQSFGDQVKDRYFWRFHNVSRNKFMNTSKGYCFLFFQCSAETCSYRLKISRNIQLRHLFQFKTYFQVLDTFHTSSFSAFDSYSLLLLTHHFDNF